MTDGKVGQLGRLTLRDGAGRVRLPQIAREVLRDGPGDLRVAQTAREVLRDGPGDLQVAQLARLVLRSRRDSPYPNFPVRLFCPPSLGVRLVGGAMTGGASPSGDDQVSALESGGVWTMTFGAAPLWTRDQVLAWRDFTAAADLGVMNCVVPLWDRRYQPFASAKYTGPTTFGQVVWRDTPAWDAEEVAATVAADAQRLAREISFTFAAGQALEGGEHLSVYAARYGWRLYRLVRRVRDVAGVQTWKIAPPLRDWLGAGTALNFDSPRCTMRPDGDISETVEKLRNGQAGATFVESFNRYP